MGGFVFETAPGEPFLPLDDTRVVLTPEGILYLMEHAPDLLPNIPVADIVARSKAGVVTKALLCFQAISFCASCAARLTQNLPVSLLEVTTFAHCLCALAAYALWLHKPQDVDEPTLIAGENAREVCALMFTCSTAERVYGLGFGHIRDPPELDYMHISPCTESQAAQDLSEMSNDPRLRIVLVVGRSFLGFSPKTYDEIQTVETARISGSMRPYSQQHRAWYLRDAASRDLAWYLDQRDVARMSLVRRALGTYPIATDLDVPWMRRRPLLNPEQQLGRGYISTAGPQRAVAGLVIAAVYGLPHLVGLLQDFPSVREESLWRVASFSVIGSPATTFFAIWIADQFDTDDEWGCFFSTIPLTLMLLCPVLYVLSSGFIVYESFRQLIALPEGAFLEPQLTRYFPHFS